jgi:hypothetical protein
MISEELKQYLTEEGYLHLKEVPNRGLCGIRRFLFTYGLVYGIDSMGYKGRWCYDNLVTAFIALEQWSGEGDPAFDWIKYKGEGGERSNPINKDEYV